MATTQSIVAYYTNLLIRQYATKPKAIAHVAALVTPAVMDQMPLAAMNAFNLSTAVGKQLDILGKYIGVSRSATLSTGPVTLSDSDYLTLLQFQITENASNGSLATIQSLIAKYFPGQVLVSDNSSMQLNYLISSSIGSQVLAQVLVKQNMLPRPMGVSLGGVVYAPTINSFFGFRTANLAGQNNKPFNSYSSIQTTWPWLSYANIITT